MYGIEFADGRRGDPQGLAVALRSAKKHFSGTAELTPAELADPQEGFRNLWASQRAAKGQTATADYQTARGAVLAEIEQLERDYSAPVAAAPARTERHATPEQLAWMKRAKLLRDAELFALRNQVTNCRTALIDAGNLGVVDCSRALRELDRRDWLNVRFEIGEVIRRHINQN